MNDKRKEIMKRILDLGVKVEKVTGVTQQMNTSWVMPTKDTRGKIELTYKRI
ncbi:hypothetical protein [Neobacillus vireti]|uniref:hypothetical protein n=1 Tax=Neobacillus vireti TaxID=220686 RepID=UPI002FFF7840